LFAPDALPCSSGRTLASSTLATFGTKKALFLAAIERCFDLVGELFRAAAAAAPAGQALQAFFAIGMLLTVGVTIGVPELMDEEQWARDLLATSEAPGEP
jgi:AcrR family transcriptional regulator